MITMLIINVAFIINDVKPRASLRSSRAILLKDIGLCPF